MIDAHNFMPCDSRQATAAPLQRSLMAPQYIMGNAYSSAPLTTMTAPQYQGHSSYSYGPYHSPPPSTPMTSLKNEYIGFDGDDNRAFPHSRYGRPEYQAPSPSSRSDSQVSTARSAATNPSAASKTITANEAINPADQVEFKTDVDELMRIIQKNGDQPGEDPQHPLTPVHTPKCETGNSPCSFEMASPARSEGKTKYKKWVCDGPNCGKAFVQKTHLDVHRRTHTGERPYTCQFPNCGLTFSQRGNLKTHQRRHNEEKPYRCSICDKSFAQKGNVRSHEKTHEGLRPFTCRLGGCGKTFSQLGNMKTHQNQFHREALLDLTSKFVRYAETGEVPEPDRDLFEYFREHYKNSNKGIKGRGKGRLVAPRKENPARKSSKSVSSRGSSQEPAISRAPVYTMGTGPHNMAVAVPRSHHGGYGVFEPEAAHHGHPASAMLYDEHARQMAFSDRLY